MHLTIEERMELSQELGAPIDGIVDKVQELTKVLDPILRARAASPLEAVLIMAGAFLFFSTTYTDYHGKGINVEKAKLCLDAVLEIMQTTLQSEEFKR